MTEVDQAVEAFISKSISETYPSHKLCVSSVNREQMKMAYTPSTSIGEETYAAEGKMELTDEFTWIVDPIDGEKSKDLS